MRTPRLRTIVVLAMLAGAPAFAASAPSAAPSGAPSADDPSSPGFRERLSASIQKSERSIKILRQQIVESQNAPFLPDLYVQLGDLLAQKALTLYYVQMERDGGKIDGGEKSVQDSQPVVVSTKEAIEIYRLVLREFPAYPKRNEVSYRLAVSLKSIDDIPPFIAVGSKLIKEAAGTEEAMRASLLLGKHFLDAKEFDEAYKLLKPIATYKLTYERDLARYWIGLIYLGKEKFVDALKEFEAVVSDPDLKEQANPYDLRQAAGKGRTDLRREALIDSVLAYTRVHEKNADPVRYYTQLAPTEAHFQEVMEKLALRYVFLKKYDQSVKLLRVTSERTADPQKILNVYREVLLLIPLAERITVPASEMQFVLSKLAVWQNYFEIPPRALADAQGFFEKQVRDLATRTHELAKTEKDPPRRKRYLASARDYYLLYLGFFERSANSVKMATDLADVYFLQGDFYRSGDYYLRAFDGEFGDPAATRRALLENAVLSLQRDPGEGFYDKTRSKGRLLRAITEYQRLVPAKRRDAKLELLRLKTEYEQGFFPEAIDNLYAYMRSRPANGTVRQITDAGDLILDYYNTRNDFAGMELWANRLAALKVPDSAFNARLVKIRKQAKAKVFQERVKAIAGYDEFAQGKSYLTAALQSDDETTKNQVLREALAKSKREHDIGTFLQAGALLAKSEARPAKRAAILRSIAQENMKVGNFYGALRQLRQAAADASIDADIRARLTQDAMNAVIMLHDPATLESELAAYGPGRLPAAVRARARDQVVDSLDSPVPAGGAAQLSLLGNPAQGDDALLALFKARDKLDAGTRQRVWSQIRAACGGGQGSPVCRWTVLESLEPVRSAAVAKLRSAPTGLKALEAVAGEFMQSAQRFQALEGSSDAHLETVLSLVGRDLYTAFADYLGRVAAANPELRNELGQKARESQASAQTYVKKCEMLSQKAAAVNPAMRLCMAAGPAPALRAMLAWNPALAGTAPRQDATGSAEVDRLRKAAFAANGDGNALLQLSAALLRDGAYHHAAALASYGVGASKEQAADFRAVLGCAVLRLGYLSEAAFHLREASDYDSLKGPCDEALKKLRGGA